MLETMSARGRRPDQRSGFNRAQASESGTGVHQALLKNARKSGQLNLSGRSLSEGIIYIVGKNLYIYI